MEQINIRLMKDRRHEFIPLDQIEVVNSRTRDKKRFNENVRSIDKVGLYKPILVNKRRLPQLGKYELVCGEGRVMAFKNLGKIEIEAEVIDIDDCLASLMTLAENIARSPEATIELARDLKRMHDQGVSLERLATVTGKSQEYVRTYLRLLEQGEERLIKGVEDGAFTMNFALNVAQSSDRSIQHLLMDAFDGGIVGTTNLGRVRRIIEDRIIRGRALTSGKRNGAKYTVDKLKCDIQQMTQEKESFVYEADYKQNRVMRILLALRKLWADQEFLTLLQTEGITEQPQLKGDYNL